MERFVCGSEATYEIHLYFLPLPYIFSRIIMYAKLSIYIENPRTIRTIMIIGFYNCELTMSLVSENNASFSVNIDLFLELN